jgi:hypothetical protein
MLPCTSAVIWLGVRRPLRGLDACRNPRSSVLGLRRQLVPGSSSRAGNVGSDSSLDARRVEFLDHGLPNALARCGGRRSSSEGRRAGLAGLGRGPVVSRGSTGIDRRPIVQRVAGGTFDDTSEPCIDLPSVRAAAVAATREPCRRRVAGSMGTSPARRGRPTDGRRWSPRRRRIQTVRQRSSSRADETSPPVPTSARSPVGALRRGRRSRGRPGPRPPVAHTSPLMCRPGVSSSRRPMKGPRARAGRRRHQRRQARRTFRRRA